MQPYASQHLRDAPRARSARKPQRYASSLALAAQPTGANAAHFDASVGAVRDTGTHWTRIFYYDVLAAKDEPQNGSAPEHEARTPWVHRNPTRQGAVLLAIYVAMHLAAGAFVRLFGS